MEGSQDTRPGVGLYVTCLVDLMRPSVGFAAANLLEGAGCKVAVPSAQACCGQPAYNAGDKATARSIAIETIKAFADFDYVVAPSGSCAAMLRVEYPKLFDVDDPEHQAARAFSEKVHELISFLVNVRGMKSVPGVYHGRAVYHDACAAKRELGVHGEPRMLLKTVEGLELIDAPAAEDCCGFGGLFSVKYPDISSALAVKKSEAITSAGPDLIVGPDLGCLMNIAGTLSRSGRSTACRHIAEVLAGDLTCPPIGQPLGTDGTVGGQAHQRKLNML